MGIVEYLRKQRFESKFIKLAKLFYFHNIAREIYYKFILFLSDRIKITLFGYDAQFHARDIDEVSLVEGLLVDERNGEIRTIQKIIEELRVGDIAYDVGASVGTHTIFMALKVGDLGKIFAFEPESKSFAALKANIALNKLNNITPLKVALGDCRGERIIRGGLGCFTFTERSDYIPVEKMEIVDAFSFIQENNLPLPNVVKIDVEGFEYHVIRGLKNALMDPACRMVACEIHPNLLLDGMKVSDIMELMDSYGYKRNKIFKRNTELHVFFYKG